MQAHLRHLHVQEAAQDPLYAEVENTNKVGVGALYDNLAKTKVTMADSSENMMDPIVDESNMVKKRVVMADCLEAEAGVQVEAHMQFPLVQESRSVSSDNIKEGVELLYAQVDKSKSGKKESIICSQEAEAGVDIHWAQEDASRKELHVQMDQLRVPIASFQDSERQSARELGKESENTLPSMIMEPDIEIATSTNQHVSTASTAVEKLYARIYSVPTRNPEQNLSDAAGTYIQL